MITLNYAPTDSSFQQVHTFRNEPTFTQVANAVLYYSVEQSLGDGDYIVRNEEGYTLWKGTVVDGSVKETA